MPIVSIDVRDGDPTVQTSGQHRGTVTATFDDGRIVERSLRAPDENAWNDLVANIQNEIQAQQEQQDAEDSVNPDADIDDVHKEASVAQRAVAYLRAAWQEDQAPDAYLLFARFANYVTRNGYKWNTVQAHLIAEGLTQEEWDQLKEAYQYLNGGGRPAIMAQNKTIQDNWEAK